MACGLATLEYLEKNALWNELESKTSEFVGILRDRLDGHPVNVASIGSIFWISLQREKAVRAEDIRPESAQKYARLFNQSLASGIYLAPSAYEVGFISTAHQRQDLINAAEKIAETIKSI